MSQKLREINGDNNITKPQQRNGTSAAVENGNDINARKAALTPLEFRVTQQRETERYVIILSCKIDVSSFHSMQ